MQRSGAEELDGTGCAFGRRGAVERLWGSPGTYRRDLALLHRETLSPSDVAGSPVRPIGSESRPPDGALLAPRRSRSCHRRCRPRPGALRLSPGAAELAVRADVFRGWTASCQALLARKMCAWIIGVLGQRSSPRPRVRKRTTRSWGRYFRLPAGWRQRSPGACLRGPSAPSSRLGL